MSTGPQKPRVSIIMPLYNSEEYLETAIKSILEQTFTDFELIIISRTDTSIVSLEIVNSFNDSRIKLIKSLEFSLPARLNIGMDNARGEYISRMDADDISLLNRLETQVRFMDSHPDIGICGTWYKTIGTKKGIVGKPPIDPEELCANLLFHTSLAHPTVMMRKDLLMKNCLEYNPSLLYCEDYDMWARCSEYFPITNIPKILLYYRIHEKSTFQTHEQETRNIAYDIRFNLLKKIGIEQTEKERFLHNFLTPSEDEDIREFTNKQELWLLKILLANKKTNIYSQTSLEKVVFRRWYNICSLNAKYGLVVWKDFVSSTLSELDRNQKYLQSLKIFLRCLFRIN